MDLENRRSDRLVGECPQPPIHAGGLVVQGGELGEGTQDHSQQNPQADATGEEPDPGMGGGSIDAGDEGKESEREGLQDDQSERPVAGPGGPNLPEPSVEGEAEAGSVKPKEILSLLHRQGFLCAYTGDPLTPDSTSADHVVPFSRGGGHGVDNLALVTQRVNAAKGSMTLDEFVDMCRKVARRFGEGQPEPVRVAAAGELSGETDPCEILTRLGYVDAAEAVRRTAESERRLSAKADRRLDPDEITADRLAKIDQLKTEIRRLQVQRSVLRSEVGGMRGGRNRSVERIV